MSMYPTIDEFECPHYRCKICCGYRRGTDEFVTKKYKASIFPSQLMKIISINGSDIEIQTERYSEEIK